MLKIIAPLATLLLAACGGGDGDAPSRTTLYKSFGSLQCSGGGRTLAQLQSELADAGITVLAASCGQDGLEHPTVCNTPDGLIGIFDVPTTQQATAQAQGFAPLSSRPGATRQACR